MSFFLSKTQYTVQGPTNRRPITPKNRLLHLLFHLEWILISNRNSNKLNQQKQEKKYIQKNRNPECKKKKKSQHPDMKNMNQTDQDGSNFKSK
jgi:hypothetical protein